MEFHCNLNPNVVFLLYNGPKSVENFLKNISERPNEIKIVNSMFKL